MKFVMSIVATTLLVAPTLVGQTVNHHALSNGGDIVIAGAGSGVNQTAADGVGVYIPGEDLRGSMRDGTGQFVYRATTYTQSTCLLSNPSGGAQLTIHTPLIAWFELNSVTSDGHSPIVFPNPTDATCATFPLGGTAGFIPFGTPAGSSASFIPVTVPAPAIGDLLVPNENMVASSNASPLAVVNVGPVPITSTGFCWTTQFTWIPSAITSINDENSGWWLWAANNPLGNQYWSFSGDEQNLWKSHTVTSSGGLTNAEVFSADVEYAIRIASVAPNTNLATWPTNFFAAGPYVASDNNVIDENGQAAPNPHGGYDLGGHGTLSLTGRAGVPSGNTGLGAQDKAGTSGFTPSGVPFQRPTLGFHTYDGFSNGGIGSKRVVWIAIDFDHMMGVAPSQAGEVTLVGGAVRLPVPVPSLGPGFPHPLTIGLLPVFGHEAFDCPSCPTNPADGLGFGNTPQGSSGHILLPEGSVCTLGMALPIAYGSSPLQHDPGIGRPAGKIIWDPNIAGTSGSKTFFVFE